MATQKAKRLNTSSIISLRQILAVELLDQSVWMFLRLFGYTLGLLLGNTVPVDAPSPAPTALLPPSQRSLHGFLAVWTLSNDHS